MAVQRRKQCSRTKNTDYNSHRQARANQPGERYTRQSPPKTCSRRAVNGDHDEPKSGFRNRPFRPVQHVGRSGHGPCATLAECTEGGEFIRNAALARDNGVTREFFVNKLVEDLVMIQSFPPQLRWFVQDSSDETLLSEAVFKVFDEPMKAEQHEASFISACIQTAGSVDGKKI